MVPQRWVKKLGEEARQWVAEGIIDAGQEERLNARYRGRLEYSRLINTVVTLGSILIGLGILLFVASNWDKLGRPSKIGIIFSVICVFNFAGYYFRYIKREFPGLSEGFLLIGAFSFGAGVWLIAQMYQIHYNFSAGIIFWILGILPPAVFYRSWILATLAAILSFIWLASYHSYYHYREGYGFFILAAVILALIYKEKQRFSLFVVMAALAMWLTHFWGLSYFRFESLFDAAGFLMPQIMLAAIYEGFGVMLYTLGIWHQRSARRKIFSFLYKFIGILCIASPAYSLTFAHHYDDGAVFWISLKALAAAVLLFSAAAAALYRLFCSSADAGEKREIRLIAYFLAVQTVVFLISLDFPRCASLSNNLSLLFITLSLMYIGFLRRSEGIFRLAIIFFFVQIISRYFDVFWKMMPRSLLFISGGVILICGAVFANMKRKEIEKKIAKARAQ